MEQFFIVGNGWTGNLVEHAPNIGTELAPYVLIWLPEGGRVPARQLFNTAIQIEQYIDELDMEFGTFPEGSQTDILKEMDIEEDEDWINNLRG